MLDQIAVDRNRSPRFTECVNLVATMEFERIGALDRNRIAVPIKRDPLLARAHPRLTATDRFRSGPAA